jgi:hypothetical protein
MQTVFIRHKFGKQLKVLEYLWNNRLIAIHYENIKSTDPKDYKISGRQALSRMRRYCESGAVVGATYIGLNRNQMLIGEIEKGSIIELLDCGAITPDINWIFKVVSIKNSQIISFKDFPMLSAIQPRLTAITGWPSAESYIAAILGMKELDRDVKSLTPSQLEVVCYEYLRFNGILKALLLPIGRTMMDVDIYGIEENGESVVAQVTHSTNEKTVKDKLDRLKNFEMQNAKLFFFGPRKCLINNDPDICYIAIEEVFSILSSDKSPIHNQMISKMLFLHNKVPKINP